MNANKALWEKGDFTKVAESMRESGEALVKSLSTLVQGKRVMDLGCGDGTTALPMAQIASQVVGVDIATNLVAAGNARAKSAGLHNLTFVEGDARELAGIPDSSFDVVLSVFGAMFAPSPDAVAAQMVRVCKKGGTIVMGNWIPGDPTMVAQLLKLSSEYAAAPPPGFVSPMLWGIEANVLERFGKAGIPRIAFHLHEKHFVSFPPACHRPLLMCLFSIMGLP